MKSLAILTLLIFVASGVQAANMTPPRSNSAGESEAYVPGLGDTMCASQRPHAKLWFAGPLAAYELDKIKEALQDAAVYQPEFKGRLIAAMIDTVAVKPLAQVESAIAAKDRAPFKGASDELTAACTSCHQSLMSSERGLRLHFEQTSEHAANCESVLQRMTKCSYLA